ncbi:hypothetical protein LINPERPRIM_LOCUS36967 [Linum perenne]
MAPRNHPAPAELRRRRCGGTGRGVAPELRPPPPKPDRHSPTLRGREVRNLPAHPLPFNPAVSVRFPPQQGLRLRRRRNRERRGEAGGGLWADGEEHGRPEGACGGEAGR